MSTRKTTFEQPAEGAIAIATTNAKQFNKEYETWRSKVGSVEILGRAAHQGVEVIYWRKKAKRSRTVVPVA